MIISFGQQDPRWAKDTLGNTVYTCGRWGCLSVVLTDIRLFIYGAGMTPKQSIKKLTYLKTGDLQWQSLLNIGLKLVERVRRRDDIKMKKAMKDPNLFVAVQVNNSHWCWLLSSTYIPILGYKIADPISGTFTHTNRYKNNITGFAIIKKS